MFDSFLLLLEDSTRAIRVFQKCLKLCPTQTYRPLHLFGLVKANHQQRKIKKAKSYFQQLQKEYPDDKHTAWAAQLLAPER
jgi:TolA-binding protein